MANLHEQGPKPQFQRLPREERKEYLQKAPRVTIIGDRDVINTIEIIDHTNIYSASLQLAGIVVPFGDLDSHVMWLADRVKGMRHEGYAIPDNWPIGNGTGDWHFDLASDAFRDALERGVFSPNLLSNRFSFFHAPYDADRIPRSRSYRREYCEKLIGFVKRTNPDIIFLNNFKVRLDAIFVEHFAGKIVNVHPSVLPLLKGWRPEYRADMGENPDATGFTYHLVDVDLDGGPTLFQQDVCIDPYDFEKEAQIGEEKYREYREEVLRNKIVEAQSRYAGDILAMVASETSRMIVEDREAFAAEGRGGFENDPAYVVQLEEEYQAWKRQAGQEISYGEWHQKERKPYRRVLFDIGNGWQTLEAILNAPKESPVLTPHILTEYSFYLPAQENDGMILGFSIEERARELARTKGGRIIRKISSRNGDLVHVTIEGTTDLTPLLRELGILSWKEEFPMRVTRDVTRRTPFSELDKEKIILP